MCTVTAFEFVPDENMRVYSTIKELENMPRDSNRVLWVDLEQPTEEELHAVGAIYHLDDEALDDCLHGDQRPRIDDYTDHFFLMLYGMMGIDGAHDLVPRKLAAFCGANFLITVHREPLKSAQELRERCKRLGGKLLQRGTPYLLYSLIDGMVDKYGRLVQKNENRLEELEDHSLNPDVDESILGAMSDFRRDILQLRRIAFAQRELILPLAKGEHEYLSASLENRFRHIRDHLTHVIERIDIMRERSRVVRENYNAALALRMNTIVKVLTIFSAVLLPLTFIASIFGMNFDKSFWPPSDHPASFAGVLIVMLAIGAGLLWFFRWRKWL